MLSRGSMAASTLYILAVIYWRARLVLTITFDIIQVLVFTYYDIRQKHVARVHTFEMKSSSVRQKLTKLILFNGD